MADEVWEEEPEQWGGSFQTSSHTGEHWQQRQHHRPYRDSSDQKQQYNDGNRQHYSQRNRNERHYNQSNQNLHRYPKPNEENWDRQKDSQHKYNNERHNRGPRYGDRNDWQEEDHQKQSDEQENRSRERSNRCRDLSYPQKRDDRNPTPRDNRDATQKTVWSRGGPNREDNESKDSREGQGAWRGKDNNLHFNKEEIKDTLLVRNSQPNQGNFSNYNNRRDPVKVEFADIVTELSGDLFSAPGEFALAHCVAQDFRMGSGIAVKFKDEFKRVGELLDQNVQVGGCAHLEDKGRYIFYLVTKEVSTGKPKPEDLKRSLEAMKAKCLMFQVKKLAMPPIGCGLDKLDWSRVKASINEVFHDADIEIRVYEWNVVEVDLGTLLSSLEEVGQCPVCLELVKPPVTLCVNGHGTCTVCKASLTKCPTCREPFCKTEPRILNEILQKIPRVCKFYDNGCRSPASDDHELYCKWRKVKCIFHKVDNSDYCDWEGPAYHYIDHINTDYHAKPCYIDIHDKETLQVRNLKDLAPTKGCYDSFSLDNVTCLEGFFFYYTKEHGNFCLYITHFPLKKPTGITYFTISFGNSADEVIYKYKIRAATMITLEREVKVEENVYCMRVPLEELEKFFDEDGSLCLGYVMTVEPL